MDSSSRTRNIRQSQIQKNPPKYFSSYTDLLAKQGGLVCCQQQNEPIQIEETVRAGVSSILDYISSTGKGPTRGARLLYIWFYGVSSAYDWILARRPISHIERCIWMLHTVLSITQQVAPSANSSILESYIHGDDNWASIQQKADWAGWNSTWNSWFVSRTNDGSVAAEAQPTSLPNGTRTLQVSTATDFTTYPEPAKWTPLTIGTNTQKYLTYGWGDISSALLTPEQEVDILTTAGSPPSDADRRIEIDALLAITDSLTDMQKVIAEFWAGGPGTYSPPGMLMWIWKEATITLKTTPTILIKSGYELASRLFETSRLVWKLKKQYMQSRPIQDTRRFYPTTRQLWVPYQEATFVTPPFADFPSGHSAFSQTFANTMTKWFGPSVPIGTSRVMQGISKVCPLLDENTPLTIGSIIVPPRSSKIEASVPSTSIVLSWATWQEMADSAGLSRQYGGIHAQSAHSASQRLANALYAELDL